MPAKLWPFLIAALAMSMAMVLTSSSEDSHDSSMVEMNRLSDSDSSTSPFAGPSLDSLLFPSDPLADILRARRQPLVEGSKTGGLPVPIVERVFLLGSVFSRIAIAPFVCKQLARAFGFGRETLRSRSCFHAMCNALFDDRNGNTLTSRTIARFTVECVLLCRGFGPLLDSGEREVIVQETMEKQPIVAAMVAALEDSQWARAYSAQERGVVLELICKKTECFQTFDRAVVRTIVRLAVALQLDSGAFPAVARCIAKHTHPSLDRVHCDYGLLNGRMKRLCKGRSGGDGEADRIEFYWSRMPLRLGLKMADLVRLGPGQFVSLVETCRRNLSESAFLVLVLRLLSPLLISRSLVDRLEGERRGYLLCRLLAFLPNTCQTVLEGLRPHEFLDMLQVLPDLLSAILARYKGGRGGGMVRRVFDCLHGEVVSRLLSHVCLGELDRSRRRPSERWRGGLQEILFESISHRQVDDHVATLLIIREARRSSTGTVSAKVFLELLPSLTSYWVTVHASIELLVDCLAMALGDDSLFGELADTLVGPHVDHARLHSVVSCLFDRLTGMTEANFMLTFRLLQMHSKRLDGAFERRFAVRYGIYPT